MLQVPKLVSPVTKLLANFFAELALFSWQLGDVAPSLIAASGLLLSRTELGADPWPTILARLTGYTVNVLYDCADALLEMQRSSYMEALQSKQGGAAMFQTISLRKFGRPDVFGVSHQPPLRRIGEINLAFGKTEKVRFAQRAAASKAWAAKHCRFLKNLV